MSRFIGYPRGRVLAVFDSEDQANRAAELVATGPGDQPQVERFQGREDADRFDATGARHGIVARGLRAMQFSLMDQLPALAWYEAALRQGKVVVAVRTNNRAATLRVVDVLRATGGHFINHFGRAATEEFARWRGPEPPVANVMKH
jgi:hypothetical protein